jgi:hypothetical protein
MPDFPSDAVAVPRITSSTFTVNLLASGGDIASVQFSDVPVTVAGLELADARAAVGNLSNAAVNSTTFSGVVEVAKTKINPLDEAYASASTKLVLVFQDNQLNIKTIAIPAPDESYFGGDGVTMITPSMAGLATSPAYILAQAIIVIVAVLNGGAGAITAGTFALLSGYRSERTRKLNKPRTVRASIEPGAGILPPALPGV